MTKIGKILTSATVGAMMLLSSASALAWTNTPMPSLNLQQTQNLQQQGGNGLSASQLQNMFSNSALGNRNFQNLHIVFPPGFNNLHASQLQNLQQQGGNNLNAFQLQNMFSNSAIGNMNHQNLHIML